MKKTTLLIFGIPLAGLFVYLAFRFLPFAFVSGDELLNDSACRDAEKARDEYINGVLVAKIRDNHSHMWKTIEYKESDRIYKSLIFRNEMTYVFDSLMVGDSIVKDKGILKLSIIRKGLKKTYQLDYRCK